MDRESTRHRIHFTVHTIYGDSDAHRATIVLDDKGKIIAHCRLNQKWTYPTEEERLVGDNKTVIEVVLEFEHESEVPLPAIYNVRRGGGRSSEGSLEGDDNGSSDGESNSL